MTNRLTGPCGRFAAALAIVLFLGGSAAGETDDDAETVLGGTGRWALTVYAFRLTNSTWRRAITPGTSELVDSYGFAVAPSYRFATALGARLAFELEGVVVKHAGQQDHWEIALPVITRWQAFPWNDVVETSAAFGLGLSWATERPRFEVALSGASERLLAYWTIELTAGIPGAPWQGVARLHHRSTAFGLLGQRGSSNGIGLGLKYRF